MRSSSTPRTAGPGTCSSGARSTPARPSPALPQVRFERDYSGGLRLEHRAVWKTFRNECRPYDGPPLAYLVTACTAPDGTLLGAAELAAGPAASRLAAVDRGAERLGAPRLPLERPARPRRALHRLGVPRPGARHLRPADLRRLARARVPLDVARRADRRATGAASTSTRSTRPTGPAGDARRRSSSASRPARSVTRSGRRTTARCRAARRGRPATARSTASASSGRA